MCGDELTRLPAAVQRVAQWLQARDHRHPPRMLDGAARTAQQAADALGVALGQIAKSIVFRRLADDAAVLVIASGDRRVDEMKVASLVGDIGRAGADFVKARTGFSIGGVAPVAPLQQVVTLIDRELFRFDEIWAAAGHSHAVFMLRPQDLEGLTGGPVADVAQDPCPPAVGLGFDLNAIKNIADCARIVRAVGLNGLKPVPSPCSSVCVIDQPTGWCLGCLRTLREVSAWSRLDEPGKCEVWRQLGERACEVLAVKPDRLPAEAPR